MSYLQLTYLHLLTVLPAALIGLYLIIAKKGTMIHRTMGKLYMALMMITAVITLFMQGVVGPLFLNHFGFIHIFSVIVLICIPWAYICIRRQNMIAHQMIMISVYIGAIIIAGGFAFMPGRLLNDWLFG